MKKIFSYISHTLKSLIQQKQYLRLLWAIITIPISFIVAVVIYTKNTVQEAIHNATAPKFRL